MAAITDILDDMCSANDRINLIEGRIQPSGRMLGIHGLINSCFAVLNLLSRNDLEKVTHLKNSSTFSPHFPRSCHLFSQRYF